MSRYRNIHCAVWSDDKFPFMSDDAQLVWFHLFTNELTNAVGIYKAPIEGLAADKRWGLERYRKGLGECLENLFLEYDERFHVVRFPKFFRWNRPTNPNVLLGWVPTWDTVPKCDLKGKHFRHLERCAKGWGEGFEKVVERFRVTLPKQEQEQEQEYSRRDGKPSLEERLWGEGLETLVRLSGQNERKARSVLGKWRKEYGDQKTLDAIIQAEKQSVSEPVSWVTASLKGKGGQSEADRMLRGAV